MVGTAPVLHEEGVNDPSNDDAPASAYLLTWNPENFALGGDDEVVPGTEHRWTCHSRQPKKGDRVYLARLGVDPRGIVAMGVVTEESFEAPHWKDSSKSTRYIRFKVDQFRPHAASGLLPMLLLSMAVPSQRWSPQNSGIGLSAKVEAALHELWTLGDGVHSLRQYVTWVTRDPSARNDEWLEDYRDVTSFARALRDDPSKNDESALDRLWRTPANGVTSVGPGALSNKDFSGNLPLLAKMTHEILAQPTAETLANVEEQWQKAVSAKTLSKFSRAVIRRVFSAASPQNFTTLLRESDCQKVLASFKHQFEISANSTGSGWLALNAEITSCMSQAGLDPDNAVEDNTAIWHLVEQLSKPPKSVESASSPADVNGETSFPIMGAQAKNLVLYGPPGTGKTYQIVNEAIRILAPELLEGEPDREVIKARFDKFVTEERIVFTTFHQSFSYEDFVEGLRAEKDESGQLRFTVVDGVFKLICNSHNGPSGTTDVSTPGIAFSAGETYSGYQVIRATADVLELRKPNGRDLPIGMGLLKDLTALVQADRITIDDIRQKQVFERVPETTLEPYLVNGYANILPLLVERMATKALPDTRSSEASSDHLPRVLVIDEINRGSVSRIFGELITLIEPSKRLGMPEALRVKLPYSKNMFGVPANLHIIATMNTADRSLVGLDIALRRRFEFREVPPNPDLLDDVSVDGVSIGSLLRVINERIELLLDRDHRLGHTYFLALRDKPTVEHLARIFRNSVLPLLQEYFFEDWQRIRWVLNDHRKIETLQFITLPDTKLDGLFGSGVAVNEQNVRWHINEPAFMQTGAYSGVITAAT